MDTEENNQNKEQKTEENEVSKTDTNADIDSDSENKSEFTSESFKLKEAELNDKYLRLYSEFDNYRKRTLKERSELIKTASEEVFKAIIPALDDLERAIKANEEINEPQPIKDGVILIYNKIKNSCQQKGLIAFESVGLDFNSDIMEAITHIAASDESQKGKVVDEIEKGYKLGDKVIRFAKVVVGN